MVKKMMLKVWARRWVILIGGLFFGGIMVMIFSKKAPASQYEVAIVEETDITQMVSVTGTVESNTKVGLNFQKSGPVELVRVKVGDMVKKGDLLARLEVTALALDVQLAEANVAVAQANYSKAVAGTTTQAVLVAQAAVQKSEADLKQAETKLVNVRNLSNERVRGAELAYASALTAFDNASSIYGNDLIYAYEDLYNVLDDALNDIDDSLRQVDTVLSVDNQDVHVDFGIALAARGTGDYLAARSAFKRSKLQLGALAPVVRSLLLTDYDGLNKGAISVKRLLNDVDDLLSAVDHLLENSPAIGAFNSTARSDRRAVMALELATVSSQLTKVVNATQSVTAAKTGEFTQLNSAQAALAEAEHALSQVKAQMGADISEALAAVQVYRALLVQAKANLAEVRVGPRAVDLASLRASISNAEIALRLAQYNLSLGSLLAPIDGVVTRLNFDVGENVSTVDDFVELLSNDFQVIANVSESDIAKVHVGDHVQMTLDAFYYDKAFDAEIVEIDPAETVVQGVIYYQVTAAFTADDTQVKPGMTANMNIITEETQRVLAIPIRAVKYAGSRTYVLVPDPASEGGTKEVDIEVGLRGDQFVEVTAGLKKGDEVVTYVR